MAINLEINSKNFKEQQMVNRTIYQEKKILQGKIQKIFKTRITTKVMLLKQFLKTI